MTRTSTLLGAVAALAVLAGCGSAGPVADPPAATAVAPPVPGAGAPTVPPTAGSAATAASAAPVGPTSWVMPDLVGVGLQDAQDRIQSLTGYGIAITRSHDATGAGRHQILDRDWRVCDQNVPAGRRITSASKIDFGAAKLTENC